MIIVVPLGPARAAAGSMPVHGNRKAPAVLLSAGALSVGDTGFEPVTFSVSGRRAPRLRQSPRGTPRAYQTPRAPRATMKARGEQSGERLAPGATRASSATPERGRAASPRRRSRGRGQARAMSGSA